MNDQEELKMQRRFQNCSNKVCNMNIIYKIISQCLRKEKPCLKIRQDMVNLNHELPKKIKMYIQQSKSKLINRRPKRPNFLSFLFHSNQHGFKSQTTKKEKTVLMKPRKNRAMKKERKKLRTLNNGFSTSLIWC